MRAKVLMIQGTASSVGKSLMTAAICRIYAQRGLRVAPFKSQNTALNSFVTAEGHEIGRAQAMQAEAAGCTPCVQMNPILLKPELGNACQVVINGVSAGRMNADVYRGHRLMLAQRIAESLDFLRSKYDLVVIEGAGSPVEINLKEHDIVNMFVAQMADAPVLLVGDIDRGGVFASLVGTMELLDTEERERVAGFIFNKFRGNPSLLGDGLHMLKERTGVSVLGVVPHIPNLLIADEDSTSLAGRDSRFHKAPKGVVVVVIRFPHLSNYDDLLPLEREAEVKLRFVDTPEELAGADLVVLPGSKCTVLDLRWLRETRLADAILAHAGLGLPVLGICGGCQMLGTKIEDPLQVESQELEAQGLALLPLTTRYQRVKTTTQVRALTATPSFLSQAAPMLGYEIHHGELIYGAEARPALRIVSRNEVATDIDDGAVNALGNVVGTMIHGILDNDGVRRSLLQRLGVESSSKLSQESERASEYDRLAHTVRESLCMSRLDAIIGIVAEGA